MPIINRHNLKLAIASFFQQKIDNLNQSFKDYINANRTFSITLNAWTAFNQDNYLGIIR